MTYTYAILRVTARFYAEVKAKLVAAGYPYPDQIHEGHPDGEVIDMHGLALQADPPRLWDQVEALATLKASMIGEQREELLKAWIAQHGYKPDECTLVSQDTIEDGKATVRCWIEKLSMNKRTGLSDLALLQDTQRRLVVTYQRLLEDHPVAAGAMRMTFPEVFDP